MENSNSLTTNHQSIEIQKYLEYWYPKNGNCLRENELIFSNTAKINNFGKKRNEIKFLFITGWDYRNHKENTFWTKLTGTLDLSDFIDLEQLNCNYNQLTNLILSSNDKLKILNCENNQLTNLDLTKQVNLEELNCHENQLTELTLINSDKLWHLACYQNQLTSLNCGNNSHLSILWCYKNQLTEIILPTNNQLTSISVSYNFLVSFNYSILNPATLTDLRLFNNNLTETNLEVFSHLINLTSLQIGDEDDWAQVRNQGNKFTGSLSSLKNCAKLNHLNIDNTNIDSGLEYLSTDLEKFVYNSNLWKELVPYGKNIALWQAYHPQLMIQAGKALINLTNYNLELKKKLSSFFSSKDLKETKATENYNLKFNYSSFFLRDFHPFSWETNESLENKFSEGIQLKDNPQSLPLRLYNLKTNLVVNSSGNSSRNNSESSKKLLDNTNYLTLSYCWGTDWEEHAYYYGSNYSTKLTKFGRKALNKVKSSYQFLKKQNPNFPDYIWIDNFCINQTDAVEKGKEVAWQRNYYSNAITTLVAIDAEIGNEIDKSDQDKFMQHLVRKIIQSPWFKRSWTFQEGLLSKQTIFMFDDALIDGRILALYWGGGKRNYNNIPHTFITPLGWSYTSDYQQSVSLDLGEALLSVSHRQQTVLVDKVYSILGLLFHGDQIKANYKETNDYTIADLEGILLQLVNQAYLRNPREVLTYLGNRNPNNWWLPIINKDGSMQIEEILDENSRCHQYWLSQIKQITKQGIQLVGHLTIKDGVKYIEINKFDDENNIGWTSTIQFSLFEISQSISIKEVFKNIYYSEKQNPQDMFVDMIEREVILKSESPLLYYQKTLLNETNVELINQGLKGSLNLSEFINLKWMSFYQNELTELMLPISEELEFVYCGFNQLNKININKLPNLIHLGIMNNNLTELDISNNLKLTWLNCAWNKLTDLDCSNNLELEFLFCENNLLNNLIIGNDAKLTELYCKYNNLTQLNLTNNTNLKRIWLGNNKLTSLDLTGLVELEFIEANFCYLTSFNYSTLNPVTLTILNISDNNLPATDIAVFSQLINLEVLWIGNWNEDNGSLEVCLGRIQQNIYNHFYGSLEDWKNLTKLKSIYISNTDINAGLEYLPPSVKEMEYSTKARPVCQLTIIEQQLKNQVLSTETYDSKHWKIYWTRFMESKERSFENDKYIIEQPTFLSWSLLTLIIFLNKIYKPS